MSTNLHKIISHIKYKLMIPVLKKYGDFERLMHMNRVLSVESVDWDVANEKIPAWFYLMILSMGIAVFVGFSLILVGSIFL